MEINGRKYLQARAAADGRVRSLLREIGQYDAHDDAVLRDQSIGTLDLLVFERRHDGAPAYTDADAIALGRAALAHSPR